ncbi:MAG: hypothetical protein GC155_13195 [Alphaproteobacteria bacterium]|nr:hypothetical protein [Alphaproteobacteria bacterium]
MRRLFQPAGLAVAVLLTFAAASPATAIEPQPLFATSEPIRLTIKGPIGKLPRKGSDDVTEPGSLIVQGSATETLAIELSTRGLTRRKDDVCSFPPLRVEFVEKPPADSLFKGQKRLKLVTHCQSKASFQQYVLLEYAAYRMYNVLTPVSFDVRLATIDYVDNSGRLVTTRVGYFIEDVDDVAKRNGLKRLRTNDALAIAQLNPHDAERFAIFQYMIGNLDWAMTAGPAGADCCHNSRPFGQAGAITNLTPTPYDFDFSGMVDAPYAVPPDSINLASVRIRKYRGFCRHNEQASGVAAELIAQKAAILGVLDETPQLDEASRKKARAYLTGSFDQIGKPQELAKLLKGCLG